MLFDILLSLPCGLFVVGVIVEVLEVLRYFSEKQTLVSNFLPVRPGTVPLSVYWKKSHLIGGS